MNAFLSGLDQYVPRFLQMFKAKMSSISQLESLLSKIGSDVSILVLCLFKLKHVGFV